jgi:integrase
MESTLNKIARMFGAPNMDWFDWTKLRHEHLIYIQSALKEVQNSRGFVGRANTRGNKVAAATTNKDLAAVKGVLREAWRMNLLSTDDYMRSRDIKGVKGDSTIGHYASPEEIDALLETTRKGAPNRGIRDEAILRVMFTVGPRVTEVRELDLSNYDRLTGRLTIRGKRGKLRDVYITNGTREALDSWLDLRGDHLGALFEVVENGDEIRHAPIKTSQTIWEMLERRCKQAGIRRLAPHDARRTSIRNWLNLTDSITASKLAGHGSPTMTARYDLRPEDAKRLACEAVVGSPFKKRELP